MSTGFCLPYIWLTRIVASNNFEYGFCSSNISIQLGGLTYNGGVGSAPTAISTKAGLATDNLELMVLKTGTTFTEQEVALGLLNGAKVTVNIEDALSLPASLEAGNVTFEGFVGRVQSFKSFYKIELRSNSSLINTRSSFKTSQYCRWEFGSPQCGLNLVAANLQYSTILVSSTTNTITLASAPTANITRFTNGSLQVTSGQNFNAKFVVIGLSGSTFTIRDSIVYPLVAGTTFIVKAGCDYQASTCFGYDNIGNFGGFPGAGGDFSTNWMPGLSTILKIGNRSGETV
jgi:uncharacterized phage protein (TIGR02218 family)